MSPSYRRCMGEVFSPGHATRPRRICCGLYGSVIDLEEGCSLTAFSLAYHRYVRCNVCSCDGFRTVLEHGNVGTSTSRAMVFRTPAPSGRKGVHKGSCFAKGSVGRRRWVVVDGRAREALRRLGLPKVTDY